MGNGLSDIAYSRPDSIAGHHNNLLFWMGLVGLLLIIFRQEWISYWGHINLILQVSCLFGVTPILLTVASWKIIERLFASSLQNTPITIQKFCHEQHSPKLGTNLGGITQKGNPGSPWRLDLLKRLDGVGWLASS